MKGGFLMEFIDLKRFSAYVRVIYHSEYITKGCHFKNSCCIDLIIHVGICLHMCRMWSFCDQTCGYDDCLQMTWMIIMPTHNGQFIITWPHLHLHFANKFLYQKCWHTVSVCVLHEYVKVVNEDLKFVILQ